MTLTSDNQTMPPHLQPVDHIKQPLLKRIPRWIRANPKKSIPLLAGITAIVIMTVWVLWPHSVPSPAAIPKPQKPPVFYSALTGREVSEHDAKRPVVAAIIENSPEARPQSGLQQAGVVFESVAEGGITRFLVLYQEDRPKRIGPVRSVRPQFASWAAAFDAGLAHVGGSAIPLKKLRSGKIKDFDQFTNPGAYWRSTERYAPHNMYTSHQRLSRLAKRKGYTSSSFTAWERLRAKKTEQQEPTARLPKATRIAVPVSTGLFATSFRWNSETKTYARSQAGSPHTDEEKGRIAPSVVIVLQVPHDIIRDSNGYRYPDANTKGQAWIFQNGTVQKASWRKTSDKEQIKFTDAAGKSIQLMPGQTWLSAIRQDVKPSW